jgi:hypothetical protein
MRGANGDKDHSISSKRALLIKSFAKKFRAKVARDNHAALGPTPLPLGSRNYGNMPALSRIQLTACPNSPKF